jgi:hypothetical protein
MVRTYSMPETDLKLATLKPRLPFTKWRKQSFFALYLKYLSSRTEITDDSIKKGIVDILPNISTELANGKDDVLLEDWIQKALSYVKTLVYDFEDVCCRQVKALDIIKIHRRLSLRFEISKISRLPLEMEKHIQSYFLPQTRLEVMICGIPNIEERIKKMTLPWLNKLVNWTIWPNIVNIQTRFYRYYKKNSDLIRKCQVFYSQEICTRLATQTKRKPHIVESIMNVLFLHKNLESIPSNYMAQLIHKTLFRIWQSVLYVESKYIEKKRRR